MLMEQLYCTCTEGHLVVCVSVSPFLNLVLASFSYQTFFSFVFWFCFFLYVICDDFSLFSLVPTPFVGFISCMSTPLSSIACHTTHPPSSPSYLPYSSETLSSLPSPTPLFYVTLASTCFLAVVLLSGSQALKFSSHFLFFNFLVAIRLKSTTTSLLILL